jgi:TolA-binding protein
MSKSQINFRLPDSLIAALKDRASEEGITSTELAIRLLEAGLGLPSSEFANDELRIEECIAMALAPLQSQITQLQERIEERIHSAIQKELDVVMGREFREESFPPKSLVGVQRLKAENEAFRQERDNAPALKPPVHSQAGSPPKVQTLSTTSWLTVGEAFDIAAERGFAKSKRTFQRFISDAIASTEMPFELKQVGLVADWQIRRAANPKDNSVRWLRFEN